MEQFTDYEWRVARVVEETPRVKSLYLEAGALRPPFIAGQYLTIKLPGQGPVEGKAYSISSAPHEPLVRVSVKRIGAFSEALLAKQPGDRLVTSAPYGFFYPEPEETTPLIFVVGGIGVTPCLSIIKDLAQQQSTRPVVLHYSNQSEADITFLTELSELADEYPPLTVHHYVTRVKPAGIDATFGRLTPAEVVASAELRDESEFFICGAMDFTSALWKGLRAEGVPQYQLYTEGFF